MARSCTFMPFNSEFTRAYYSDVDKKVAGGLLMQAIMEEVNQKSGLYTYTFDETDLENLRSSIMEIGQLLNEA